MHQENHAPVFSDRPSVRGLFAALWRRRFLTCTIFVALVVPSAVAISLLTPLYEAASLLTVGQGPDRSVDSGRAASEAAAALTKIAESPLVIKEAARKVGPDRLKGSDHSSSLPFGQVVLPGEIKTSSAESRQFSSSIDQLLPSLSKMLSVKAEMNSDIVRIAFRHVDAAVAADFVNAISQAAIDRQLSVFSRPGVARFYEQQSVNFNEEVRRASDELAEFMIKHGAYAVDEQKQLLLKRSNDLAAALVATRGQIAERNGQKEALTNQLRKLGPVTKSPFVLSLVDAFGAPLAGNGKAMRGETTASDAPLLMVKVYQDSMAALFKTDSDLKGLENLEAEQTRQLSNLNNELAALSLREVEFNRLRRAVLIAATNADTYAKRTVEEKISVDLGAARLSNVKLIQEAYAPIKPVSPNFLILSVLAAAASLLASAAIVLAREYFRGTFANVTAENVRDNIYPNTEVQYIRRWAHALRD